MGGVGLAILTFVFGLQPTAPPIDVMLMIVAVITAASCMQAAGGLDYMVKLAAAQLGAMNADPIGDSYIAIILSLIHICGQCRQKEHLQPPFPERDRKRMLSAGLFQAGKCRCRPCGTGHDG